MLGQTSKLKTKDLEKALEGYIEALVEMGALKPMSPESKEQLAKDAASQVEETGADITNKNVLEPESQKILLGALFKSCSELSPEPSSEPGKEQPAEKTSA